MKRSSLYIALLFSLNLILLASCNKNEKESAEDPEFQTSGLQDTLLSPEESLSTSLVQGILGEDDEPELEEFIEQNLYEELKKSAKVTIDRVSTSEYAIEYDLGGERKVMLLRKYYDPQKDVFVFARTSPESREVKTQ
ncbi:MAG: hypothetical protein K1X85_09345 [Ignavibacteria bacterium]|nr:hypothetical protein [Ignavibacteria bacterium]